MDSSLRRRRFFQRCELPLRNPLRHVELHAVQQRQRPAGHVVELIGQALPTPPNLLLHKRIAHGRVLVQQGSGQPLGRLRQRNHVRPRRKFLGLPSFVEVVVHAGIGERLLGSLDFHPLLPEQGRQFGGAIGIPPGREDKFLHRPLLPFLGGRPAKIVERLQQLLAVACGCLRGGKGGNKVVLHRIAIEQHSLVIPLDRQPAHRRLLIGHADGAVKHRPPFAVAGIKRIEHFPREVIETEAVKPRGVVPPIDFLPLGLRVRQVWVPRLRRRGEVVGRIRAHLVQVNEHHREPLQKRLHPAPRFRLRERKPVPVHVKQVVVHASGGPGLIVLGRLRVLVRLWPARLAEVVDEAVAPIGILHRVDDDHALIQNLLDQLVILRRRQVVGGQQARIGAGDFVPVHPVLQPGHGRQRLNQSLCLRFAHRARVRQPLHTGFDFVQTGHVGLGGNNQVVKRPALPALGVAHQPHLGRSLRQLVQVALHLTVHSDPLAPAVPHHLFERRHRRVIGRTRKVLEGLSPCIDRPQKQT